MLSTFKDLYEKKCDSPHRGCSDGNLAYKVESCRDAFSEYTTVEEQNAELDRAIRDNREEKECPFNLTPNL